ncbi:hypothetical protein [Nostoc sp.]|uniref:hypothetical protein n=1 Tax=Nostoc sp. TaxID=1180 RepID=UPI002FFB8536
MNHEKTGLWARGRVSDRSIKEITGKVRYCLGYIIYIHTTRLLALSVAVRILQPIQGRGNPDLPTTVAFFHEQQQSTYPTILKIPNSCRKICLKTLIFRF